MAFEGLTTVQRELVGNLVENLASGDYSPEFWALATLGRGWFVQLNGQGGAASRELSGFEETDLHALVSEGYITLIPKNPGYAACLKPRAYSEYKASRVATAPQEDGFQPSTLGPDPVVAKEAGFDEAHLQRIEHKSVELIAELHENYGLSRKQAASWFRWTLLMSLAGFTLLAVGAALALTERTTVGTVSAVGGVAAEFLALVFFKQTKDANDRQYTYHRDLVSRQKVLDAVQVLRLVTEDRDRNRLVETIIRQLLGVDEPVSAEAQPAHPDGLASLAADAQQR